MINIIAIVEDDDENARVLIEYIERFNKENKNNIFETVRFSDGMDIVSDYKPIYSIILMDIQMKNLNGMETAKHIRNLDKDVIIIFITNMAQYAIKGYSVNALDFLLKPVPYFAFQQQLKQSIERLKSKTNKYILIPTDSGVLKLNTSKITYIESFKHQMIIHTYNSDDHQIKGTMFELEEELKNYDFYRCNKSFLVNLAYISSIEGNFAIVDNTQISISRNKKKVFLETLVGYVGGLVTNK